jgi:glycerol-3-phosphate acyltransferase PlsY
MRANAPPTPNAAAAITVLTAAYLVGSVPVAQIAARWLRCADLRGLGSGTVSASALRDLAGLGPMVVAGTLDLAKGAVGPLMAGGRRRPALTALAAAATVSGHNWSPFLGGAGGRGLSPAMGALLVAAPEGAGVLLAGLAAGRAVRQTAVGAMVADAALMPVLARTRGRAGVAIASAVLTPMLAKRLRGNRPAAAPTTYLWRLLFDRDQRRAPTDHGHAG